MLDQHLQIIEQDVPPQTKISQLFNLCEHLYRVLDKTEESQRDLMFVESVCERLREEGFRLKIEESEEGYTATFWRGQGEVLETYSHTSPKLEEAVSTAGNRPEANKIIEKIRQWREEFN